MIPRIKRRDAEKDDGSFNWILTGTLKWSTEVVNPPPGTEDEIMDDLQKSFESSIIQVAAEILQKWGTGPKPILRRLRLDEQGDPI